MFGTILDWLPLIALGAFVVCCVRPVSVVNLFVRGALENGNEDKATRIVARYARMRPKDPGAWLQWAWLLGRTGNPWGPAGILREGLEHNPDSLELGLALARELLTERKESDAHELLGALREQHPEAPGPPILLAWQAAPAGNLELALELCREGRRHLDPVKHTEEAFELGHLLLMIPGQRDDAEEVLRTAAEHSDTVAPQLFMVALTERVDPRDARRYLAHARFLRGEDREDLADRLDEIRAIVRA